MTQRLNTIGQRVRLQGTWEQFKLIQQISEDSPGVKLAFYNGEIELFMPGEAHEFFSEVIGYLVATFLLSCGISFKPTGSKTQEKEGEASVQAALYFDC